MEAVLCSIQFFEDLDMQVPMSIQRKQLLIYKTASYGGFGSENNLALGELELNGRLPQSNIV